MKRIAPLIFFLFLASTVQAQIYADVSVSQGATALGTFRIQLHHDKAPRTVANFIGLATGQRNWIDPRTGAVRVGQPFYNGLTFHRLVHNFMIQGGDPLGTGAGGPGYIFQDEFDDSLSHSGSYIVSMANSGWNSNGSQFFITLSAPTHLDNKHSIFGEVIDDASYPNSRALIDSFKNAASFPTNGTQPATTITIDSVTVSGLDLAGFDIHAAAWMLPTVSGQATTIHYDSDTASFSLGWDAARKYDYPLYYSSDLENWFLAGRLLSMDDNADFAVDITGIAMTPKGFYINSRIDYSHVPQAPQDILAAGGALELEANGGSLILSFDGNGGGSWQFVYTDTGIPTESGGIASSSQTNSTASYLVPTSGFNINPTQTYARFLSVRQITVFLDGQAGPDLLTAIQPELSFHTNQSGWFDGAVNTNAAQPVTFRGQFNYTEP